MGKEVVANGKKVLNMASYDFLGISGDSKIMVRFHAHTFPFSGSVFLNEQRPSFVGSFLCSAALLSSIVLAVTPWGMKSANRVNMYMYYSFHSIHVYIC